MRLTRRTVLASTFAAPLFGSSAARRTIVVTGAHPGDPECGCAGTIARFSDLGDDVILLYLNRGEAYCGGAPLERCAAIRTREAEKACEILSARPAFAGQIDGQAVLDNQHYEAFAEIISREKPASF